MKCEISKLTGECTPCFKEWLDAPLHVHMERCHRCRMEHMKHRMVEKLEGHYCESCAKEYEEKLLAKMTS